MIQNTTITDGFTLICNFTLIVKESLMDRGVPPSLMELHNIFARIDIANAINISFILIGILLMPTIPFKSM